MTAAPRFTTPKGTQMMGGIELGKIIELPCDIGDAVYLLHFAKNGVGWITRVVCAGIHITDKVSRYYRDKPCEYLVVRSESCGFSNHVPLSKIGKTVFLSEAEARKALDRVVHGPCHGCKYGDSRFDDPCSCPTPCNNYDQYEAESK